MWAARLRLRLWLLWLWLLLLLLLFGGKEQAVRRLRLWLRRQRCAVRG